MKRRDFLGASCAAGLVGLNGIARGAEGDGREYYELRKYRMGVGPKKKVLNNFMRDAALPAFNRAGVGPVGVFNVMYGANEPTLYVLLVHKSLESVFSVGDRLAADGKYQKAGASFLNVPLSDPAYVRMESWLMAAFAGMPKLEIPTKAKSRIFELRTYESHSVKAGKKKIEMFNDAGEIAVFRKTGLNPVFFGESLIGPRLSNLTYMLGFDDMATRDKNWNVFRKDPDWLKLKANTAYHNTVSNISDTMLRPASYSQI